MNTDKATELEELLAKQKEARKEFKVIEKYIKKEIEGVRERIGELENMLEVYYKLEDQLEYIFDEAQNVDEDTKFSEAYTFKIEEGHSVFENINLVRGDYLIRVNASVIERVTIELKKKVGRRVRESITFTGQKDEVLVEIQQRGEYYLSVKSRSSGGEIEIIRKARV